MVTKVTGHVLPVDVLVHVGLSSVCDQLQELVRRIRALRLDASEYTCLKFVILLNPGDYCCDIIIVVVVVIIIISYFCRSLPLNGVI